MPVHWHAQHGYRGCPASTNPKSTLATELCDVTCRRCRTAAKRQEKEDEEAAMIGIFDHLLDGARELRRLDAEIMEIIDDILAAQAAQDTESREPWSGDDKSWRGGIH